MRHVRSMRVWAGVLMVAAAAAASWAQLATPSGAKMTAAAQRFVESLTGAQRAQAILTYDLGQRTDWHYIPKVSRKGLQVREMNDAQRKAAFELLESALSAVGYDKATRIMQLETILKELEKTRAGGPLRDAERYYFTIFDQPAPEGRWGLSIEGHHLSLNFVVQRNRVISSTPTFFGANPATLLADYQEIAGKGFEKGLRVLAQEEQLAFDLLHALSPEQRKKAIIADKAPNDISEAGKAYPPLSSGLGLPATEMTAQQVAILKALIEAYARNVPDDVAGERLAAIERDGIQAVWFAWSGADKPGVGHDYRVQGKSFLIEFNNTQPDSAGNPANHIHSVWHNRAGNFGIPVE